MPQPAIHFEPPRTVELGIADTADAQVSEMGVGRVGFIDRPRPVDVRKRCHHGELQSPVRARGSHCSSATRTSAPSRFAAFELRAGVSRYPCHVRIAPVEFTIEDTGSLHDLGNRNFCYSPSGPTRTFWISARPPAPMTHKWSSSGLAPNWLIYAEMMSSADSRAFSRRPMNSKANSCREPACVVGRADYLCVSHCTRAKPLVRYNGGFSGNAQESG